jgi:phospholipase C
MIEPILPQIDHIVYVMFENRSLDNVLGWLYDGENDAPEYDGLREGRFSLPYRGVSYPIRKGVGSGATTVPDIDPHEAYTYVLNQLFGDGDEDVYELPAAGTPAQMQGFLRDFSAWWEREYRWLEITDTYTANELAVLYGLARGFAVSDRWHASVATETNPNRAYALCGTSLGRLANSWDPYEQYDTPTVWNALASHAGRMGIYYHESWLTTGQCYTQYTFPRIDGVARQQLEIVQIDDTNAGFWTRARTGELPAFSYIEPKWGGGVTWETSRQGNDYHPPTDVQPGEKLLHDVYTALRRGPKWNKTLLIVTFDEHGGTFDHRGPPWGATNPGDVLSKNQPAFSLFGVRVPALLVSPYVPPRTVFRAAGSTPYDHTSIIATLLKWKGVDPTRAGLGNRVAAAPTFESVLSSTIVNPGVDLADPGDGKPPSEADRLLAGFPAAHALEIVRKAKNLEQLRTLAQAHR